ncbi:MAG: NAD-dependent epimerase/dehydratase family protein [Actinomycetaceae bacterium]
MSRVVLTGAGGSLGTDVLPALLAAGHEVVAVDLAPPAAADGVLPVRADVRDLDQMRAACRGADALLHLAGIPLEAEPDDLWDVNIRGTQVALEAARLAGIRRAVLASSIHAVGFHPVPAGVVGTGGPSRPDDAPGPGNAPAPLTPVEDDIPPRPNTFYGVSKVALEALGHLYADRFGMEVVLMRIASRQAEPTSRRHLQTWLSPADAGRLVVSALAAPVDGCITVWGVSANVDRYVADTGASSLGFVPTDDAGAYREAVESRGVEDDPSVGWLHLLGGEFCSPHPPRMIGTNPYREA